MTNALTLALAMVLGQAPEAPGHDRNAIQADLIAKGLAVGGATVRLPEPTFPDGQSAEEQAAALKKVVGSDQAVESFLRDSVTAPSILKLRDEKVEGATIRSGDLYFALRVDVGAIDPAELSREEETAPIEAGNMRFQAKVLKGADLQGGKVPPPAEHEGYIHTTGRLLDRIAVESTAHLSSSRSAESIVVASTTDHRFDASERWGNFWKAIKRQGTSESAGPAQPYHGGIGYVKITRLKGTPDAAIVEVHFSFIEPLGWFDGAPILRSKFGLMAQDQVRSLRRELAARTKGGKPAK